MSYIVSCLYGFQYLTGCRSSKPISTDSDDEPIGPSKLTGRMVLDGSEDENPRPPQKRKAPLRVDDDESREESPPRKKTAISSTKANVRKSVKPRKDEDYEIEKSSSEEDFIDDEPDDIKTKIKRKSSSSKKEKATKSKSENKKVAPTKAAAKPKSSNLHLHRSLMTNIFDSWAAIKAAKLAGPSAPGSKQVPDGAPNCLLGLSFVFTGELSSFSREEAVDLAKRFGGYVFLV